MIAIANSSNTNTDWVILSLDKKVVLKTNTHSMNPTFFSNSQRYKTITQNKAIMQYASQISSVYLHTSGVSTPKEKKRCRRVVSRNFPKRNHNSSNQY